MRNVGGIEGEEGEQAILFSSAGGSADVTEVAQVSLPQSGMIFGSPQE